MADDDARCTAAAAIVAGTDQPPGRRAHAERVEERPADPNPVHRTRLPAAREIEGGRAPGKQRGKSMGFVADALPERVGHARIAAGEAAGPPMALGVDADLSQRLG